MDKKIAKAKVKILLEHPFFASGILRLDIQNDSSVKVAAVNPYGKVKINPKYIEQLDVEEVEYLLCHELMHVVLLHLLRRGNRNPNIWNIAIDMAVDTFLAKSGLKVFKNRNDVYVPPKPDMSAEELYEFLRNKKLKPWQFDVHLETGMGQEQERQQQEGQDQEGEGQKSQENKSQESKGQENKGQKDKGKKTSQSEIGVQERAKLEEQWKGVLIDMMNCMRMRGNVPEWIEEAVQEIIEPPIPWHIILQQFVQNKRKCGSSWLPPNRKYLAHGIYLPSYYEDFVKIGIAIDTSGSISSSDLQLFFGALNGVISGMRNYELIVVQCDTRITDEQIFTTGELPDTKNYKFKGRGGTDFRPVFERFNQETELDGMIYLTDGDGTYPEIEPSYPVLWVLTEEYDVPFGEKIIIKKEEKNA